MLHQIVEDGAAVAARKRVHSLFVDHPLEELDPLRPGQTLLGNNPLGMAGRAKIIGQRRTNSFNQPKFNEILGILCQICEFWADPFS